MCLLLAAGASRSVQNNRIWMAPRGSKSAAVAATSGQPMDVDTASVPVDTCRVHVNRVSAARSYIQPATGNFINKDSGRQLSLAARGPGHTSTTNQRSDARSHTQPAAGTFRNQDSATQWSPGGVTSTSAPRPGAGAKSYMRPAQGNFMNMGSTRPDASLGEQLPDPLFNPGVNPGGVLGNKERPWYSMDVTGRFILSFTYLVRNV